MKETIEMKDLSGPTVLLDPDRNERNNWNERNERFEEPCSTGGPWKNLGKASAQGHERLLPGLTGDSLILSHYHVDLEIFYKNEDYHCYVLNNKSQLVIGQSLF